MVAKAAAFLNPMPRIPKVCARRLYVLRSNQDNSHSTNLVQHHSRHHLHLDRDYLHASQSLTSSLNSTEPKPNQKFNSPPQSTACCRKMATPNRTYVSNGQVLETLGPPSRHKKRRSTAFADRKLQNRPPLSARLSQQFDNVYNFFGLYFTSLFSVRRTPATATICIILLNQVLISLLHVA